MSSEELRMPLHSGESEYEDRKSVFLGHAAPVQSEDEAKAFISEMKKQYGDARHNVWAYCLSGGVLRSSDDGEPSGTGGAPVLDAIVKRGLCNAVVVVTRYFGGILLGTGGLVRAYTLAASEALSDAGCARVDVYERVAVVCSYAQYGLVTRLLEKRGALKIVPAFAENVTVSALLPREKTEDFRFELTERSGGALSVGSEGFENVISPI